MTFARKWVFPLIRTLVLLAIAAALVKLAFFADVETAKNVDSPSGQISEPLVTVATGTVVNTVQVSGSISADAARTVKATAAGLVEKVLVTSGKRVHRGTAILRITAEVPGTPKKNGDPGLTLTKLVTVYSPTTGTLSNVPVIAGQVVAVGDPVASVAPPTFSVSGSLTPEQLYRLLNRPKSATVTITGGPAPFRCTRLAITSALAGAGGTDGVTGPSSAASGSTVSCAVPAGVRVFNGLQARISIPGGTAASVLVVPVTAVEGIADVGNVYVQGADGKPVKTAVKLGLNDGKVVQIVSGLSKGDQVLEFVPGATAPDQCSPDGGSACVTPNR